MLLHGAALDEPTTEACNLVRLRCEICSEIFDDSAKLTQHLQQAHQLQGMSYNESRDVLPGSTACAHCGLIFRTADGVKSHIVQGRCQYFDPRATAETSAIDERWIQACLHGQLHSVLQPPMTRLALTLHCQMCGKVYRRSADLAGHLQAAHSRLWRQAQRLTQILVGLIYTPNGCCCNPSIGIKRGAHICLPLRQLAMSFHRMDQGLFAPFPITDDILADLFSPQLPREIRFQLEKNLAARTFAQLWQDDDIVHCLSTHCLQCGLHAHPADLCLHLREAHIGTHPLLTFYMEQMVAQLQHQNLMDHQCTFCVQIFNLPACMVENPNNADRFALAQSHFKGHCPFTLQLAWTFASVLHGGRLSYASDGADHRQSDPGNLPASHANAGQRPAADTEPQIPETTEAKRKTARTAASAGKARPERKRHGASTASAADDASSAARPGTELAAKRRLFCPLFQSTTRGSTANADEGGAQLCLFFGSIMLQLSVLYSTI